MDRFDRNRLVQLADRVPDEATPAATRYLEYVAERGDPFVRHLFEAPAGEEALSEGGQRLRGEAYAEIEAVRLCGNAELQRGLGL